MRNGRGNGRKRDTSRDAGGSNRILNLRWHNGQPIENISLGRWLTRRKVASREFWLHLKCHQHWPVKLIWFYGMGNRK